MCEFVHRMYLTFDIFMFIMKAVEHELNNCNKLCLYHFAWEEVCSWDWPETVVIS